MEQDIKLKLYINNKTMILQLPIYYTIIGLIDFLRESEHIAGFIQNDDIKCKDYLSKQLNKIAQISDIKTDKDNIRQLIITFGFDSELIAENYIPHFNSSVSSQVLKIEQTTQNEDAILQQKIVCIFENLVEHDFRNLKDLLEENNCFELVTYNFNKIKEQLEIKYKQEQVDALHKKIQELSKQIDALNIKLNDQDKIRKDIEAKLLQKYQGDNTNLKKYEQQTKALWQFWEMFIKKYQKKKQHVKKINANTTPQHPQLDLKQFLNQDPFLPKQTKKYMQQIIILFDELHRQIRQNSDNMNNLLQKNQQAIYQSVKLANQTRKIFDKSKTFQKYQKNLLHENFLIDSIANLSKYNIKTIKSVFYQEEISQNLFKKDSIQEKQNLLILFDYNGRIFGIYSETPIGSKSQFFSKISVQSGFFFSLNEKTVLFPKAESSLWKCSPYQLIIGEKFLQIFFNASKQKLKLTNPSPISNTFDIQANFYEKVIENINTKSIKLSSLQIMTVEFEKIQ